MPKKIKEKEIKRLNIKLIIATKEEYEIARKRYIANFTEYHPGGFFRIGTNIHNPEAGKAKWEYLYPNGYADWLDSKSERLNSIGQQETIDKLNEIIDYLNSHKT